MTATARAGSSRPVGPRPAAHTVPRRRPVLHEVPPPAPAVAGNGMFALIVVGLLLGGMVTLLVLNTTLAQGAFEIGSLTKIQRDLAVNEQRLLQKVARAESPEALQERAERLGMVPATTPVFLRLADRAVLGTPTPAVGAANPKPARARLPVTTPPATTTSAARARAPVAPVVTSADGTSDEAVPDAPTGGADAAQSDAAAPEPPTADGARP